MFKFITDFKATLASIETKIEAVLHQLEGKFTATEAVVETKAADEVKAVEAKVIVAATPAVVVAAVETVDTTPKV